MGAIAVVTAMSVATTVVALAVLAPAGSVAWAGPGPPAWPPR